MTHVPGRTVVALGRATMEAREGSEAELWRGPRESIERRSWSRDSATLSTCATWSWVPAGEVVALQRDAVADWRTRVRRWHATLGIRASDLDLGFVRAFASQSITTWQDLGPQHRDFVLVLARHLWDRYIPDVNGIQLLTAAHLDRVGNLDGWLVEEVAAGRYLVQASDLEPWYAQPDPQADVLAQPRAQFADVLLTRQIVDDNPSPDEHESPGSSEAG